MTEVVHHTGGCLCGAIRYEVLTPLAKLVHCHCTDCQRASGAGASANAVLPSAKLRLTQGEPKVFSKTVDSGNILHRSFCGDCGSPIHTRRDHTPEMTVLKVGSLDDSDHMAIALSIWMKSRRPWMPVDPDADQLEGNRPS
ncbi:MAG: GFA family protein [Burkholderiaceae bacterium]